MAYNGNNKERMKKTEIAKILEWHNSGKLKTDEAVEQICSLSNVVGRSEQLKCQCKKAQFTRTVDADFNPMCGRCGKAL